MDAIVRSGVKYCHCNPLVSRQPPVSTPPAVPVAYRFFWRHSHAEVEIHANLKRVLLFQLYATAPILSASYLHSTFFFFIPVCRSHGLTTLHFLPHFYGRSSPET